MCGYIKTAFLGLISGKVKLDSTPADAVLDNGNFATLRKKARNTSPVPRSSYFGETIHMDIVSGPDILSAMYIMDFYFWIILIG